MKPLSFPSLRSWLLTIETSRLVPAPLLSVALYHASFFKSLIRERVFKGANILQIKARQADDTFGSRGKEILFDTCWKKKDFDVKRFFFEQRHLYVIITSHCC